MKALNPSSKQASSAIKSAVSDIASGPVKFQDDPAQLYGIRKSVTDQLRTVAGRDNSASQLASRELQVLKKGLDRAIEKAAPGYAKYLAKYADMSKPVDAYKFLQSLHLTDTQGNVQLGRVESALRRIREGRTKPGARAEKSVSDKQVQLLENIRDDLKRSSRSAKGKAIGSNTFQNIATASFMNRALPGFLGKSAAKLGPQNLGAMAGGLLGFLNGGFEGAAIGGAGGSAAGRVINSLLSARNEEIRNRLIDALINPSVGQAALNRSGAFAPAAKNALAQRLAPHALPAATVLSVNALSGR